MFCTNFLKIKLIVFVRVYKKQYSLDHIANLKTTKPAQWWKELKSICRFNTKNNSVFDDNLTHFGETVSVARLPDVINTFFVSVGEELPSLDLAKLDQLRLSLGSVVPDKYIVDPFQVFIALSKIPLNKSPGPDLIPVKVIRNLASILSEPICAIINSSIHQGIVPEAWKMSRITPLPKCFPPSTVENDIRPIAITNQLAKIAEKFVSKFFNEHFELHLDSNQFGCTSSRSTTHALIKILHQISQASDNSKNFIRILFVDFSKAFDKIDHNILFQKFVDFDFPPHIAAWSLSFLHDRKQYVKIGNSHSETLISNAGTPQGTISGPNDFKLLINDLVFDLNYAKYVDDTTVVSISTDPYNLDLQHSANKLIEWTNNNHMIVNETKTKEMLIHFGTKSSQNTVPCISINGKEIERIESFKLLGVVISSDLSWQPHVDFILKKAAKRIYCIHYLVRAGIRDKDIIIIYCSIIRSILEYACPVWHPGLTKKQSSDIERVQKRCLKLIYPHLSYAESLQTSELEKLQIRREALTKNMFNEIKNETHVLHSLLPFRDPSSCRARNSYPFVIPITKSTRFGRAFIPYCISKRF